MSFFASSSGANKMPVKFDDSPRAIVAIDFGTSHSGYAMMHVADTDVDARYDWDDAPQPYCKNLTSILYKYDPSTANPSVENWGYTAKKIAMRNISNANHQYIDRFKLYLDEKVTDLPALPAGRTALEVIADLLRNLYVMILSDIEAKWGGTIGADNIIWFLTVPAMWTEKAKQGMREAAAMAGLVPKPYENSLKRLKIVLEPEAAAMACCQQSEQFSLVPGETFMIVDAGGGTVDLTVHEILHDPNTNIESLREISRGHGKSCGSTFVDEEFLKFFKGKLGADNVENFRASNISAWFKIIKEWEGLKCSFKGSEDQEEYTIELPSMLRKILPRKKKDVVSYESGNEDDEDGEDDDKITITAADFRRMFDPVINDVLTLVESQLQDACHALDIERQENSAKTNIISVGASVIDKMFFVGGFSNSPYLWKKAKEKFGSRVKLFRPSDPGSAVVKGAAWCGRFPRFISSRRSRLTYGIKTSGPWTPDNPAGESAKIWNEDEQMDYADNLFHVIVNINQEVGIKEVISTPFIPVNSDQDFAELELYTTDLPNETYMIPSMKLGPTLKVPLTTTAIENSLPLRIQFVQDVSGSMDGEKLLACKDGLKVISRKFANEVDEVGLIKFGPAVEIVSAIQPHSTNIENEINSLCVGGMTALYDGIVKGVQMLKEREEISGQSETKNILLVCTDGAENYSKTKFSEIEALLKDPGISNFKTILAIAGDVNTNAALHQLCTSDECKAYCEVIHVRDSGDGIKEAFRAMDKKVQLLKSHHLLEGKAIRLDMEFGGTHIEAEAFVKASGARKTITMDFYAKRSE